MDQIEPLIVGCHHKTGTKLFFQILKVVESQLLLRGRIIIASSEHRKLPFSIVLPQLPRPCCYIDTWFEHEMDVAHSSVRFLHFVRHPADRVRSAYLYHLAGAPGDKARWIDWRIFTFSGKAVSYYELLNIVDDKAGLLIEALRSYPEIAGTARAAGTSAHLTQRLQLSLEQIAANFDSQIQAVCEFIGLDKTNVRIAMDALKKQDLSKMDKADLPNTVTRHKPGAENLKRYLLEDSGFNKLYSKYAEQTGFERFTTEQRTASAIDDALVSDILDSTSRLLADFYTDFGQTDLRCNLGVKHWISYALQSFGEGGHLMMYEFIQTFLQRLNPQESRR